MNRFDIYWAKYIFEDNPNEFKIRPVLILDAHTALPLGAKITSTPPRILPQENDYQLLDWQEAGLDHPSTVRLQRTQDVKPLNYIGHLSKRDISNIEQLLKKSSLIESDHTQQAINRFGTTYYKTRAGFMLKDGRLLDFIDEGGYRNDHREISMAMEDEKLETRSDYLIAFMNEGNIRLIPEIPGVDIPEEPTEAQYKSLKDYIQFWVVKERHFEVQFSSRRGEQEDWKEYEGLTPASEIILDIEQHFNPEEFEESFLREDYTVPELLGTDHLYHATYKPYWDEIKRTGRIKPGIHSNWEGLSHDNAVYLSTDYDNAVSYAEIAEDVPEEYLDQLVVLEIDATKLNSNLLHIDENQVYDDYDEVNVEDPSTWIEVQYEGSIPVAWITNITGDSESLTEMYPHKGERKTDFINRFMREMGGEFPKVEQRYAVAYSYWDRSRKDRSLRESLEKGPDIFDLSAKGESSHFRDLLASQAARDIENVKLEIKQLTPTEYFEGCAEIFNSTLEQQLNQVKFDKSINTHLKEVLNRGEKFPLTSLNYADRSQEGRHRMYAAGELYGWNKTYPVAVFTTADEDLAKQKAQEAEEERIWKLIDRAVQRAWDFSYHNIEELREELIYLLSSDIKEVDSKLSIVESNHDLIIRVDEIEYFIEKNNFDWISLQDTAEDDSKIDDLDDFSIEELEVELRKAGLT